MGKVGPLDQLITLQAGTEVADGGGGKARSWANFATNPSVWADPMPLSGGEGQGDGARNASGKYLFRIRNRSDVTEQDRILWGGEAYNITNVKRRGAREIYLSIEAVRGVAQ